VTLCCVPNFVLAGELTCKRKEVLQFVTNVIQGTTFNARIDHWTIAEVPTSTPDVVRCYAQVQIVLYNTPTFGPVPLITHQMREYSVRKLVNGFEVALSPPQGPFP
jgi:hypothetical protein